MPLRGSGSGEDIRSASDNAAAPSLSEDSPSENWSNVSAKI